MSIFKERLCYTTKLIPRSVLFAVPDKITPQISPNGHYLAYLPPFHGIRNIWIRNLQTNEEKVVTREKQESITQYYWLPASDYILYRKDAVGDECYQLYAIKLSSGITKKLTDFASVRAEVIHISSYFPHEVLIGLNKQSQKKFDVYCLNVVTGDLNLLFNNPGDIGSWFLILHAKLLSLFDQMMVEQAHCSTKSNEMKTGHRFLMTLSKAGF